MKSGVDRTIVVAGATLSARHDCMGEEVVLRLVSRNRAKVIYADRCPLDPAHGCDGMPAFLSGETVRLPDGWEEREEKRLDLRDLQVDSPTPLRDGRVAAGAFRNSGPCEA